MLRIVLLNDSSGGMNRGLNCRCLTIWKWSFGSQVTVVVPSIKNDSLIQINDSAILQSNLPLIDLVSGITCFIAESLAVD
jgi:hypothetical protein